VEPPASPDATPAGALQADNGNPLSTLGEVPSLGRPSLDVTRRQLPDRLQLPTIGVDTSVVEVGWQVVQQADGTEVSEWEVAEYAAGWHKNSATPGEGGNVVVSGHNNIKGAVFRKLYTLAPGDIAYVWSAGRRHTYRVEDVMILPDKGVSREQRRKNAQWIQPFDDDRLTLVSCWPENDNTHRVVVVAKRIEE
jgi:sortase A